MLFRSCRLRHGVLQESSEDSPRLHRITARVAAAYHVMTTVLWYRLQIHGHTVVVGGQPPSLLPLTITLSRPGVQRREIRDIVRSAGMIPVSIYASIDDLFLLLRIQAERIFEVLSVPKRLLTGSFKASSSRLLQEPCSQTSCPTRCSATYSSTVNRVFKSSAPQLLYLPPSPFPTFASVGGKWLFPLGSSGPFSTSHWFRIDGRQQWISSSHGFRDRIDLSSTTLSGAIWKMSRELSHI